MTDGEFACAAGAAEFPRFFFVFSPRARNCFQRQALCAKVF